MAYDKSSNQERNMMMSEVVNQTVEPFINLDDAKKDSVVITRVIDEVEHRIELTSAEVELAFRQRERVYKLEDAIGAFVEEYGESLESSQLSEDQKEWLLKMNSRFEDSLRDDAGIVWSAVFQTRKDEVQNVFPQVSSDYSEFDSLED